MDPGDPVLDLEPTRRGLGVRRIADRWGAIVGGFTDV